MQFLVNPLTDASGHAALHTVHLPVFISLFDLS